MATNGEPAADAPLTRELFRLDATSAPTTALVRWGWVLLFVLAAVFIRVRLIDVPFERDEGEYAYQGALILAGDPPYRHVYMQKLPGTHLVYALSMAVFGATIPGARAALLLATSATCIGVFLLGRRLFSAPGAVAAGAAYALLALSTELVGPFAHATHYVAMFAVWGLLVLDRALDQDHIRSFLLAGFLLGLGVLMKQHGLVFVACAVAWIATGPKGRMVRRLASLLVGGAIPGALVVVWFLLTGAFGAFWYWAVRYAAAYGTMQTVAEGWSNLRYATSLFLPQAWLLWLLAAGGVGTLLTRRFPRPTRLRLSALAAFSFLGVCPGLYFRDQYFLLFLPAAALLAGAAVDALAVSPLFGRVVAPAVLLLACAQPLWAQREVFFQASPEGVARLEFGGNLFPESIEIARYVKSHTSPTDTLVVFGSEPQIPFYAQRRSATGFIYMYPLMEPHSNARRMQETMVRELETQRPAYAVVIRTPTSWLERPESDHYMQEWADRWLNENYTLVGQILVTERGSHYLWDAAAIRQPVSEATQALVMRRKDFAPVR